MPRFRDRAYTLKQGWADLSSVQSISNFVMVLRSIQWRRCSELSPPLDSVRGKILAPLGVKALVTRHEQTPGIRYYCGPFCHVLCRTLKSRNGGSKLRLIANFNLDSLLG
ncbi:hypothetical protein TNCV_3927431 [Trichonephila clavipes]|nr:hypothetical protein TNCV_3927431 [Trichonephila clavipes]